MTNPVAVANARLEAWILQVAERVVAGQPVEDGRVECKKDWPAAEFAAARRLAAHLNAAGSNEVLWIVGLDERAREARTPRGEELANWWLSVRSHFDEPKPTLLSNVIVHHGDAALVGLLFESGRPPYIVELPREDRKGGATLEVPWREGNSVRSARHSDLIRVLIPSAELPALTLLAAYVVVQTQGQGSPWTSSWTCYLRFYAALRNETPVTIPRHDIHVWFEIVGTTPRFEFPHLDLSIDDEATVMVGLSSSKVQNAVIGGGSGLVIRQSGSFVLICRCTTSGEGWPRKGPVAITVGGSMIPVGASHALSFSYEVPENDYANNSPGVMSWAYSRGPGCMPSSFYRSRGDSMTAIQIAPVQQAD